MSGPALYQVLHIFFSFFQDGLPCMIINVSFAFHPYGTHLVIVFFYDVVLYLVFVSLLRPPSTLPPSIEVLKGCDDNDNDDKFAKNCN